MKTGTQKEFFQLFYRAHRMVAKGKDPMGVINEAIGLAYRSANDEVMMCRLYEAKFRAEMALLSREPAQLSLLTRLHLHKVGCQF
ncbi:hypothetical protein MD588_19025 [Photobacterium sp. SDRW27]|uniref:hypothetical protein n=1 Tax=Photobacterium obscurum TaxID=2829490 RepID=UPI002242D207|nr:hypothetical protein [Photobacterium obscurum]MCW8330890.1 hypothetical protein [Photobacterium obscurum]